MELMFDNANLETLQEYTAIYPYAGITCNPTIIKQEGKLDFFNHFKQIREMIGFKHSLHVQVVSLKAEEIIEEAKKIVEKIDQDVYIKIPVTEEGLKAIKILKEKGYKITATAIYSKLQGLLAIAAGADYIAPYYNRIAHLGQNPCDVISVFRKDIDFSKAKTKILAASFHTSEQVTMAIAAGADAVTLQPKLLKDMFNADFIDNALIKFAKDWEETQGCKNLLDCE